MMAWVFALDSVFTEMVKGKILKVAGKITEQDITRTEPKLHCVRLAVDAPKKRALRSLIVWFAG